MTAAPTPESFWVENGTLLAGRYPYEEAVAALVAAGVTLFVDLTHPDEGNPPYEQLLPKTVRHVSVPFSDFSAGSEASVRAALDAIDAEIAAGGIPYVHCLWGCGRTGTVIGCRLVRHGLSPAAALASIRERCGHDCPETEPQRAMIRGWSSEQ